MEKIEEICLASKYINSLKDGSPWIPPINLLLAWVYSGTDWKEETPADLWSLLGAMQEYAFKHHITDFYEMVLRFTLSECFGEEH